MHSVTCHKCKGNRLNSKALSVTVHGLSIAQIEQMEISALTNWLTQQKWNEIGQEIANTWLHAG